MFELSETSTYFMPAHFGGFEGANPAARYHDVTAIMVSYETDPGMLAQYVPAAFQLTQPVLNVQYARCRAVEWLAGGGYNIITVGVPVAYAHGPERLEGLYALVLWENKTEPILRGREQSGMPKIFADIPDHRELGSRAFTNVSYEGWTFLSIDLQRTSKLAPEELAVLNQQAGSVNVFGWRYVPNIGRAGAALSYATLFPQDFVYTAAWRGEGRVHWEALTQEQYPVQAHITQALSQLPIKGYRDCLMTEGGLVLRNDIARQLP